MNSIDDLIRSVLIEEHGDTTEAEGIAHARSALLDSVHASAGSPAHPRPTRRGRRWSSALRVVPAAASCLLAILVGGGAVLLLHHRPRSAVVPLPPAAEPVGSVPAGAEALAERLAVLRRPQTAADRLPALAASEWARVAGNSDIGSFVPSLTRLITTRGAMSFFLVVAQPLAGSNAFWPVSDGDQVTVAAVTPRGLTVLPAAAPASALVDADRVAVAGIPETRGMASIPPSAAFVAIVPDGVVRVSWTFAGGRTVEPAITDNVAIGPVGSRLVTGSWFNAEGRRLMSTDAPYRRAEAAFEMRRRSEALAFAERTNTQASPRILRGFDVFSLANRHPIRLSDGYQISRPSINELPTGVLEQAGSEGGLDLRDVRLVRAPSGLSMYVVPGRLTLCEFSGGADGGGGGCAGSLQLALAQGVGTDVGNGHRSIQYIVRPTTHPIATVYLKRGTRTVEPEAGVLITRTSATFG